MLGLIIYIIAALCFIAAVVLLTFIPHKAARIVSLVLFCLLFIGGMTFVLFKASGQSDLGSVFDAMSGQTQSTGSIGSDVAATPDAVDSQPEQTAGVSLGDAVTVTTPMPPVETPQTSPAQTPAVATAGVVGMWVDPSTGQPRIEIRQDGTCTIYFATGTQDSGTYTFDTQTNTGMMLDTFSLWYTPETDTITYVEGNLVREGADAPDEKFSILRMWYEEVEGQYRLEFAPDGSMRYIMHDGPYAGTYTFDAATGQGQVDIFGEIYGMTYDFGSRLLSFDGFTYAGTPPGAVTNGILGMWYEQDDGLGLLEFFPDGTLKYYWDIDPETGTYIFDDAAGHGDVYLSGYTYELIYDEGDGLISYEGGLYSRIPW